MRRWWAALAMVLASGASHAATPTWHEAQSPHFVVYSDDDAEAVSAFATKLERFDKAMRVLRRLPDEPVSPTQRVTVFVLRDIGTLQKLLGNGDVAGVYMPRVSGPVAFVPRETRDRGKLALTAQAVLLHEYAHHFMFSTWGGRAFPAWFVEGFAEFNATVVFEQDRLLIGAPPLYRAYGLIDDQLLPMKELLTRSPESGRMSGEETQTFYGRSWLLTHYMLLSPERRPVLGAYFDALNAGKDAKTAAALLGDPRTLDRALNAYSRTRLPILGLKTSDLPIGTVTVRALTPGETAIMPVRLRSTRGVDARSAPGVATAARKVAAAWPNDPAVQVVLAEAEYDARQYEAADAAAARALAAAPRLRGAFMYRGLAQTAMAHRDHVTDAARWKDIRTWFRRANRLDADDPWPLVAFYQAYRASGEPMTENAEQGLSYAYALAPFDRDLAMTVATVHMRHKRWPEAAAALRRVAYDPHGGQAAAAAGAMLAVIDSGNTALMVKTAEGLEGGGGDAGKTGS